MMDNNEFLISVVNGVNSGYYCSPTSPVRVKALHSKLGNIIEEELGADFGYYGLGGVNGDKEMTLSNGKRKHNMDCVFEKLIERDMLDKTCCGAIECKTFFSSAGKNLKTDIERDCFAVSEIVRPKYKFAFFAMLNDTLPMFNKSGFKTGIEENVGKKAADLLIGISNTSLSEACATDLVGLCVYSLTELDYGTINTKDDYSSALLNYKGPIVFKNIEGIKSTERFVFNDPNRFVNKFVSLVKSPKKVVLAEEFAKLFSKTPIPDQEQYLISHGLLPNIPSYII